MAARLEKTSEKAIYRAHRKGCPAGAKRCECPYVLIRRDSQQRQVKQTFPRFDLAREAKRTPPEEVRAAARSRFDEYAREWIDSYRGRTDRGIGARTRRTYRRDLENWSIPFFGRRAIGEIEPRDVRKFVKYLEGEGLRPATVRGVLAPVKAMFAEAVTDGTLRINPTREVRIGGRADDEDEVEIRALTKAELRRLLDEVPDEWRLFFEFLTHSGLRISEAIGLQWRDVRFGDSPALLVRRQDCRGEVGRLKTKGSKRDLPLSPAMARRLWTESRGKAPTDRVFTTKTGKPLSDGNLRRRVLKPAAVCAGLLSPPEAWADPDKPEAWPGFHSFRHTCASLLFERGRTIKQVSKWLGHADPGFTLKTYVHLLDDGLGDADFLDEIAAPAAQGNARATQGPKPAANRKAA